MQGTNEWRQIDSGNAPSESVGISGVAQAPWMLRFGYFVVGPSS